MTFDILHSDIDFQCVRTSDRENNADIFLRKFRGNQVRVEEFNSNWEDGRRSTIRPEICSFKGVSFYMSKNGTEENIVRIWKQTKEISPRVPHKFYCRLKFNQDAGLVRDNNAPTGHINLYKCDQFDLSKVAPIEIIEI